MLSCYVRLNKWKGSSKLQWYALTCPVCGFRFPTKKFCPTMKPIIYPVQIVSGGGRAKGFKVVKYLPWPLLATLRQTDAWVSVLCLYERLGSAYDRFYEVLGFLSPEMKKLVQELQRPYGGSYSSSLFPDYGQVYSPADSSQKMADAYSDSNYSKVYAHGFMHQVERGDEIE